MDSFSASVVSFFPTANVSLITRALLEMLSCAEMGLLAIAFVLLRVWRLIAK